MRFSPPFFSPGCVTCNNFSFPPPLPPALRWKGRREGQTVQRERGKTMAVPKLTISVWLRRWRDGHAFVNHNVILGWACQFASLWLLIDAVGEASIGAKWLFGSARFPFRWSQEHIQIGNLTCKGDRHGNTESCFTEHDFTYFSFLQLPEERDSSTFASLVLHLLMFSVCHFNPCWCSFTCCYFLSTF